MNNNKIITYRGASAALSELKNERASQLEQQQGARLIQYRGASAEVDLNAPHVRQVHPVQYRGATGEMKI
jgi:hypothetical protein|tara:strand:+ start:913 stop:1122 length:210 start_codon:yes stop_codon:yes gene_type:complete